MLGLELLMASHLLFQQVSTAAPITCPAQKSARVDVRWRSEPIEYDLTKSHAQLGAGPIDSQNPYGTGVATDVGGLMTGKIRYSTAIQVSSMEYPTSRVTCLWIDKVTMDILVDPTIQIASEFPEGTCKHNAVMEHEKKHVATDIAVVQAHLETIRLTAGQAVQKVGVVGPKPFSMIDGFKKKMSDYVEESVKAAVDDMYKDRVKRQQKIDTKSEYDRVEAVCADQPQ